jgi:hypothetical protein
VGPSISLLAELTHEQVQVVGVVGTWLGPSSPCWLSWPMILCRWWVWLVEPSISLLAELTHELVQVVGVVGWSLLS